MASAPPIPVTLWDKVPADAQAALLALLTGYEQRLAALQAKVNDLGQRLNQNSTNSSKPPSSDGPHVKRRPPKPPSGKKRGGQTGHPRQQRPLLEATQTRPCKPGNCRRCGRALQ